MFDIFYNVMIRPVEYLIEIIFTIMYSLLGHEGYTLIGMSIAVSTLVLPLYARAEAIQEEEREKQKSMERWMAHIKKTFTGDERYMMQTAYFAETGYKPLYALKGTLSLLLQIPFFMAAYHFLSHLQILSGAAFGPITDLAAEDGLICIGTLRVNLLPVLMTVINGISSAIYTKGFTWKQKLQPYVLAAVFLVLLYRSPSGLVLYWTMNNVYSLGKNLVGKHLKYAECYCISITIQKKWTDFVKRFKNESSFAYHISRLFKLSYYSFGVGAILWLYVGTGALVQRYSVLDSELKSALLHFSKQSLLTASFATVALCVLAPPPFPS